MTTAENMLLEREKFHHNESNLFFVMDCHAADMVSFYQNSLHKCILN